MEMSLTVPEKEVCANLEMIVKNCSLASLDASGAFEKALMVATGIQQLRAAITPAMMARIMPLMNTKLGFLTDRDPNKPNGRGERPVPYSPEVVKECFIEATLTGLSLAGNEFNILFGGMYVTKNGFKRKIKDLPGFSDLKTVVKVPRNMDGGAIVGTSATWRYNGISDSCERDFAVKLQAGMGSDAAIGKAERRLYKLIFEQTTGTSLSDGEADDSCAIETTAIKQIEEPIVEKLARKQAEKPPAKPFVSVFDGFDPAHVRLARAQLKIETPEVGLTPEQINQIKVVASEIAEKDF